MDIPLLELLRVCTAGDEPEELVDYAAPEDALRCEQGKSVVGEIELEWLRSKEGESACACSVCSRLAVIDDARDEGKVLLFFMRC